MRLRAARTSAENGLRINPAHPVKCMKIKGISPAAQPRPRDPIVPPE